MRSVVNVDSGTDRAMDDLSRPVDAAAAKRKARVVYPELELCTDNGAMIAFAGALRLQAGQHDDGAVHVTPRWDMATLPAV